MKLVLKMIQGSNSYNLEYSSLVGSWETKRLEGQGTFRSSIVNIYTKMVKNGVFTET